MKTPERDALLDQIRRLEREARPLEPGATHRKRMRDAVIGSSERFLRGIDTLKGFEETEDQGIGLLDLSISERGIPVEAAVALLEREVIRPGANPASAGPSTPRPWATTWPRSPTNIRPSSSTDPGRCGWKTF
jgi:hypothetical protein